MRRRGYRARRRRNSYGRKRTRRNYVKVKRGGIRL